MLDDRRMLMMAEFNSNDANSEQNVNPNCVAVELSLTMFACTEQLPLGLTGKNYANMEMSCESNDFDSAN